MAVEMIKCKCVVLKRNDQLNMLMWEREHIYKNHALEMILVRD